MSGDHDRGGAYPVILKRLEVFGFKSFADKTSFDFGPGVTGLVGPNGCGKSNVVDAVRWVLGEQSAKSLRGSEMADVIFNGANGRPPLGYAEATLTFSNTDGRLPIEFEDVAVTRRVYRSGQSEYFLNRNACRLRDIRELFMDTGVGLDAYSVIGQGRVAALLQANPQERRAIFEEAAGISKYKAQRKASIANLERTEQNLLRINDIIEEIEKRLRSIKRQASKARRFTARQGRLKELRTAESRHNLETLIRQQQDAHRLVEDLARKEAEVRRGVEAADAEVARTEEELNSLEQACEELRGRLAKLEGDETQLQSNVRVYTERRGNAENQARTYARTAEERAGRVADLMEEVAGMRLRVEEMTTEIAADREEKARRRESLRASEAEASEAASEIETRTSAIVEVAQEKSNRQNEVTGIEARNQVLDGTRSRITGKIDEANAQVEQIAGHRKDAAMTVEEAQLELRLAERAVERLQAGLERGREAFVASVDRLRGCEEDLARAAAELHALERLSASGEGVEEGVRALLKETDDGRLRGVAGMLAEVIEVESGYATAIEAALESAAQTVMVSTFDEALAAARRLDGRRAGRASVLPLSIETERPLFEIPADARVIGLASRLVRADARYAGAIEHLLGSTVIVRNLETAASLARRAPQGWRFVSISGALVEASGIVAAGRAASGGLIVQRAKMNDLREDIDGLTRQRDTAEGAKDLAARVVAALEQELGRAEQAASGIRNRMSDAEGEVADCDRRLGDLHRERELLGSELADVVAEIEQNTARRRQLGEMIAECDRRRATLDRERIELQARKDRAQERTTELIEEVRTADVALAQKEERLRGVTGALAHREEALKDLEAEAEAARNQAERARRLAEELAGQIETDSARLGEVRASRQKAQGELSSRRQSIDALRQRRTRANEVARTARGRLEGVTTRLSDARVRENEVNLKIENVRNRMKDLYAIDIGDPGVHVEGFEGEVDWDAVRTEIDELQQKIEAMGSVNTDAIAEEEEIERRAQDLKGQREDLETARRQLQEAIRKLNRTCTEMFTTTFEMIRANFQELFRKLFGGGKADVMLETDADPLEGGIDIIACPPGKQPRSISLLSGGEQSLTAVALLFAVFRTKPSPFCILDEVDAALDERNIGRFVLILQEFLKQSQFLIITHSKKTMGVADAIYGVTMQEPGVSTRLSVKFEDVSTTS